MTVITFGKHKGSNVEDVPTNYLEWGSNKLESPKWRKIFSDELIRRAKIERLERLELIANLDSPEVMEKLIRKYIIELEVERAESGCEWEYDSLDFYGMAKEKALIEIMDLRIEKLQYDYQALLEVDSDKMDKLHELHWRCPDEVRHGKFTTLRRKRLALEYLAKMDELYEQRRMIDRY